MAASQSSIDRVHSSSKDLASISNIEINTEKIDLFLEKEIFSDLSRYAKLANSFTFAFPLNFDNDIEELTLIGLIALLNFGGEYDPILYEHLDQDTFDTIRGFVFSLYLSSATSNGSSAEDPLSSEGMQKATLNTIASHMRISIMVEKPHPTMPAITVGEPGGPLLPFVQRVVDVLRETGTMLVQSGYASIGVFLAEGLREAKGDPDVFISRLVRASPTFGESLTFSGREIYTYRRAIHLVLMVAARFNNSPSNKAEGAAAIDGQSPIDQLPAVASDALATALLALGIMDVAKCKLESLRSINTQISTVATLANETEARSGNIKDASDRRPVFIPVDRQVCQALHAASIYACDVIAERAQTRQNTPKGWNADGITAAGLSAWFSARNSHIWTGDVLLRIVAS